MTLDTQSVTLLMVVICALTGVALLVVVPASFKEVRGPRLWGWATLLQAVGWLVFGVLRAWMPAPVSIVGGQLLIQYSLVLYLRTLHDFFGVRFRGGWWYGLMAFEGAGLILTSVVVPDFRARQVLMAAAKALVLGRSVTTIASRGLTRSSHRFTAALFAICGVVMVLRMATFVFWESLANEAPLEDHWLPQVTYLGYFVFGVSLTFGFVAMCADRHLDARRDAEERFRRASLVDPLTQLPNRAMISERIRELVGEGERTPGDEYAVLFVDLDGFKRVNDTLGHETGDALLVETGRRLTDVVRDQDEVARSEHALAGRFGGDEFVVVLDAIHGIQNATAVADRILIAMRQPFLAHGCALDLQCSIGVSTSTRGHASLDDLIRDSDTAMYAAKAAGGNRYVVFEESMRGHLHPHAS